MLSRPANHSTTAVEENRFAAWAEPVFLRQREQWQRKKLSNAPMTWNLTAPHRQLPDDTFFITYNLS